MIFENRKYIMSNWATYRAYFISIVAVFAGVGIQAYALNIENRRTLWLLTGIILCLVEHMRINSQNFIDFKISNSRDRILLRDDKKKTPEIVG